MYSGIFRQFYAKFLFFVVFSAAALILLQSCSNVSSNSRNVNRDLSLDEQFKESQVINQEAQAHHYNKQAENAANPFVANSAAITTAAGILLAVLTISLQNYFARKGDLAKWQQAQETTVENWKQTQEATAKNWKQTQDTDREKWKLLRQDDIDKRKQALKDEIRKNSDAAAADLIKKLAIAMQSMAWVSWVARNDIKHFSRKLIDEHDESMKTYYNDIVSAQVLLASLDEERYLKTVDIVNATYDFDQNFALAARDIDDADKEKNPDKYEKDVQNLGALWGKVYGFSLALPDNFFHLLDSTAGIKPGRKRKRTEKRHRIYKRGGRKPKRSEKGQEQRKTYRRS